MISSYLDDWQQINCESELFQFSVKPIRLSFWNTANRQAHSNIWLISFSCANAYQVVKSLTMATRSSLTDIFLTDNLLYGFITLHLPRVSSILSDQWNKETRGDISEVVRQLYNIQKCYIQSLRSQFNTDESWNLFPSLQTYQVWNYLSKVLILLPRQLTSNFCSVTHIISLWCD